ncbi:hypothetical protein HMF8227_01650 [Saliniradius amylolyticus]|uniref:Uncharacterized protein n=1 Tax=Saliniradius amylolyticus TaxID=2183582 RepID=A0A2S2E3A7_9ALTE|nr:transporter substrate-binding domain-containing protein [Saliniradius amylolyticus]AWL12123.1 hypothetical protein HMF8227_01650 [Saliniradius amylolyticus]
MNFWELTWQSMRNALAVFPYRRAGFILLAPFFSFPLAASGLILPAVTVVTELSPPAQTIVSNEVDGVFTRRVRQVLQDAGIESQFYIYPWARALNRAKTHPNTLIYGIAKTPQRQSDFVWLGEIGTYQLGLVHLSQRPVGINALADLQRFSIAVQREDIAYQYLSELGLDKQLMVTADIQASWRLLLNGKVDLVVDDPNAMHALREEFGLPPEAVTYAFPLEALFTTTYLAAHPNTHPEVIQRVRQALADLNRRQPFKWSSAPR